MSLMIARCTRIKVWFAHCLRCPGYRGLFVPGIS